MQQGNIDDRFDACDGKMGGGGGGRLRPDVDSAIVINIHSLNILDNTITWI